MQENASFISGTKLQYAWDSVSLGALKECPRKYELSIIEGWEPKSRSVDLHFGILLHSARERFYHAKATGKDHDEALLEALRWTLEATFDVELGKPWSSEDSNKNRATLVRTVVWYCDQWRDDPLTTTIMANGKPAVELSFRFPSGYVFDTETETHQVLLCGHLDRLARFNDKTYISDLKSTKHTLDMNFFNGFSPDNQMSLYSFAVQVVWEATAPGIIIDAAQIAVTFTRFQRGIVSRTQDQLDEWHRGLGILLAQAQQYANADFWPMNEKACWRCAFRKICSKPKSTREEWLRADFQKRTWNPLVARGDI